MLPLRIRRSLSLAIVLCGTVASVAQDGRLPAPVPIVTSSEALDSPYGRRLVDDLAEIFAASVDRDCLRSRGIAAPGRDQALSMLVRYGQRMLDTEQARLDPRAVLEAFTASAGPGALAEMTALARHPRVRELITLGAPIRAFALADAIAESFDRHLILARVRLARQLNPIATGAQELLIFRENQEEADSNALDAFVTQHADVAEVQRFIDLLDAWTQALRSATPLDSAPHAAFEGIIPELRASCLVGG